MKLFTQGLLARRRIVLVFLLAILLPALVVCSLSVRAFLQRREAVRRLLASHLWVSGESAVQAVEAALLARERDALRSENFSPAPGTNGRSLPYGRLFFLDSEFLIVVPSTGSGKPTMPQRGEAAPDNAFSRSFRSAEALEYLRKDFGRAADAYREAVLRASTDREKAIALGARGRCLVEAGHLAEARRVYDDLRRNYGRIQDQAGHPLGLTAALQIHEIDRRLKQERSGLKELLDVYRGLQDGGWPVSRPEYEFLVLEIQSLIESDLRTISAPELNEAYRTLKNRPPPYLDALLLADFLRSEIIPRIKERMAASTPPAASGPQAERLLTRPGGVCRVVSYVPLTGFDGQKIHYGGFCWSLESLRVELLPQVLSDLSAKLALTLDLADDGGADAASDGNAAAGALLLSFREFPLPWKLRVSQPEQAQLESAARREDLVYGALFGFIVVLMLLGAVLLARDITRESETTRLRTEFVHNISHELKTPLTLIRLYGETLQRKENLTDEERRESYEIITKESERLSHLIDNVLDSSRIEMGRKEFRFARGSLPEVVKETLDSYRYHLAKKGFQVREEIALDLPEMSFDREAIAGALINLLSNAMKFSSDRKDVMVRLFRDGGSAVIQVEDRGIGIARRDLTGIFKRFYRARTSTVPDTPGSGLGLALVKHTVEAHGGKVEVESEPGEGSTFSIRLPLAS